MTEVRYCWRCAEDVPALNEEEMSHLLPLWQEAVRAARVSSAFAVAHAIRTHPAFEKVAAEYERLTGRRFGTKCLQVFHKLSDFGPPCPACNRPLRSAEARQCLLCGWRRLP